MIQMDSSSNIGNNRGKIDEAAVNSVLKTELDKINDSLLKITQCVNVRNQIY